MLLTKGIFKFFDFLALPWETKHIIFPYIREQMRSEMENISEKITEEGGQFGILIPNSITWTPFLLITMYIL